MNPQEYERLLAAQKGKRAICGTPASESAGGGKRLQVDRCHSTGKIRSRKDNVETPYTAVECLRKWS